MKTVLTFVFALALSGSLLGQGIISFANNNATKISTNGVAMTTALPGTWYYALFRAPSTKNSVNTSLDPLYDGWTLVAIGTNTTAAGRLSGNQTSEGVVVTSTAPSTDDYAVAGWSSNIGTTWALVEAFYGNNPHMIGQNVTGNSVTSANGASVFWFGIAPTIADNVIANPTAGSINGIFGTTTGLINGFSLPMVVADPEPSVSALFACLGSVLLFRRRRIKLRNRAT